MVKLTFVVVVIVFSLFMLVYGRPIDSDQSIIDFNDDKAAFNGKILLDTIFVDTTIPPAEDAKSVGLKVKTKKIESESKSKPADIAKQAVPIPAKPTSAGLLATAPQPIGLNLFGPQGLSERFLQDPRSRLLLSRLGESFLGSLSRQQSQRNSRQLPAAGFAGGNAFSTAGGLNGLLNAFNPAATGAGRAPSGFNAGKNFVLLTEKILNNFFVDVDVLKAFM